MTTPYATRLQSRSAGVRLFLLFLAVYALTSSGNPFRAPDEFEVYFQAEHLADSGDISVPQTLAVRDANGPIFFGKFGRDGKPYAPYGPGVAFLILPFHLIGRGVAALAGVPRAPLPGGIAWEFVVGGVTSLATAFAAALAVWGCHRAALAVGAPPARAAALALVLGGCTILWSYGKTLYSEAWLAAAFAWAAALLLEGDAAGKPWSAALLIAAAVVAKPTAVVVAPAFVVAVLFDRRGTSRGRIAAAVSVSVAIGAAAAIHAAWNVFRFGNPLDFGYNLAGMIPLPPAKPFMSDQVPRGLFVQLLSPGKSLFVWAPIALVSLLSLRECWKYERGLAAGLIAGLVAALVFYAAFLFPDGGYSHGPRHLVPLVPLLVLPLAVPAIEMPRRALIACAAIGFAMNALAATVSFFEDQAPVQIGNRLVMPYYEPVAPAPGRPNIRYRMDYIPFKFALTSGAWLSPARPAGNGPDFFALHLRQARRTLPGGDAIPPWLPSAVSLPWLVVLASAALLLRRPDGSRH